MILTGTGATRAERLLLLRLPLRPEPALVDLLLRGRGGLALAEDPGDVLLRAEHHLDLAQEARPDQRGPRALARVVVVEPPLEVVGGQLRAVDRDHLVLRGEPRLPRGRSFHDVRDRKHAAGLRRADAHPRPGLPRRLPVVRPFGLPLQPDARIAQVLVPGHLL